MTMAQIFHRSSTDQRHLLPHAQGDELQLAGPFAHVEPAPSEMSFVCLKYIWVCLKIGYIPNYSHLIGIMIINQWV